MPLGFFTPAGIVLRTYVHAVIVGAVIPHFERTAQSGISSSPVASWATQLEFLGPLPGSQLADEVVSHRTRTQKITTVELCSLVS